MPTTTATAESVVRLGTIRPCAYSMAVDAVEDEDEMIHFDFTCLHTGLDRGPAASITVTADGRTLAHWGETAGALGITSEHSDRPTWFARFLERTALALAAFRFECEPIPENLGFRPAASCPWPVHCGEQW